MPVIPAIQEAEAGEWRVQGGFEKHSETLSKKKKGNASRVTETSIQSPSLLLT
jgi:hypothetical protein